MFSEWEALQHPRCTGMTESQRIMAINRRYYVFHRELLLTALGRRCWECDSRVGLTFDLKVPKDGPKHHHGRMSWRQRMNYYWKQFLDGNLQILCVCCNPSLGDKGAWGQRW
jgi:hypothetical protein